MNKLNLYKKTLIELIEEYVINDIKRAITIEEVKQKIKSLNETAEIGANIIQNLFQEVRND